MDESAGKYAPPTKAGKQRHKKASEKRKWETVITKERIRKALEVFRTRPKNVPTWIQDFGAICRGL